MRVLIVNSSDLKDGSAKATYRLHRSLLSVGINSEMLVQQKMSDDFTVTEPTTKIGRAISLFRPSLDNGVVKLYKRRKPSLFSPAILPFSGILHRINESNVDLVHLHWITGGMMRVEDISRINKPIVWSLHDMWAFTGGCHYDNECNKYIEVCEHCPNLRSAFNKDLSYWMFKRKSFVYQKTKNIVIVGLSRWLAECARQSYLLKDKKIVCLPNPIDISNFKPIGKQTAKSYLGISKKAKLVLFGATNVFKDKRKGFDALLKAIPNVKSTNCEFAVFGTNSIGETPKLKCHLRFLGRFSDDISLRIIYSAADVVVVPSLQENLSNVIVESLACGTPVVGFNIGGNPDLIEHKKNGYLANLHDSYDLAKGIDWVLNQSNEKILTSNARIKAVETYSKEVVVKKYLNLYKSLI